MSMTRRLNHMFQVMFNKQLNPGSKHIFQSKLLRKQAPILIPSPSSTFRPERNHI